MSKIAAIGELECIWIFKAYGADVYPAVSAEQVRKAISDCIKKDVGIVFITETAYSLARTEADGANAAFKPALCIISDPGAPKGMAEKAIRQATLRAVGADITN